ncbi:MAG: DUF5017 domain-containing protein [Paludibacter sp.]|nr:DUF5017 domain-containing protein [Bacteroidales bacterium]MCM1068875.1 DUF5017 domain-containing protein [Prevotella sp.]MCM1353136.1 DUF5017 domain-containing protein [Bacteroides sp.]MCM1442458.1 DUF5017 domain-containing protein [Muribaculum sp.]MCM1481301.1 DUF5017 domain-containing protein [Paludibacter sp.]
MKKIIYIVLAALCLVSCENFFLEHQLNYEPSITVVRNFTYTLSEADYATIAANKTNIQTALAMGSFDGDSSVYNRLQNLATDKYFADTLIAPEVFIPAFMADRYPQYSEGTMCEVTYRITADAPIYYADFKVVRDFNPATPLTSIGEIIPALDEQVNALMKRNGYKFVVNFSDDITYVYQYQNDAFSLYESEMITPLALTNNDYAEIGTKRIATPATTLNIYLSRRFPYATADTKYLVIYKNELGSNSIKEFSYDGTQWNMLEDVTEESMSFEMKDVWKANISTYLSEPFIGHGQGNFVIQNVYLQSPLTYVWYYSSTYGMCVSAYKDGESWDSEAWLVSPVIKLKKAHNPQLIFDHAFNKATNFTEEAAVLVSTDYKGDVTTATWTALEWAKNEDGTLNVPAGSSWVFQTSDNLDMSAFAGQSVYLAFRYTTSGKVSGTWELKNVLVYEPETAE